jgi:putative membrane protein
MVNSFIHWILSAIVIGVAALLVPGVSVTLGGALLAAVVLALLSLFIKPLLDLVTLPINVVTLGLFSFVINAVLILAASAIVPGFSVAGFGWALVFAVVLSLLNVFFGIGVIEPDSRRHMAEPRTSYR